MILFLFVLLVSTFLYLPASRTIFYSKYSSFLKEKGFNFFIGPDILFVVLTVTIFYISYVLFFLTVLFILLSFFFFRNEGATKSHYMK